MAMELKTTGVNGFVKPAELTNMETLLNAVNDELLTGKGAGSDFLGWLDLPVNYDKEEFARIQKAAKKIQSDSDVLVVIGIGGSYLGARAAIEFCKGQMYNGVRENGIPEIYFVGNNISSSYINDVVKIIGDRDFSVNIISKSGTTTEPAIAFRVFKKMLEEKYGAEGAKSRIYATTDKARGALKNLANVEGYESFVVPDDVGGRFSVLTAVGLLPIAAAGIDIAAMMKGAADARECCKEGTVDTNPASGLLYVCGSRRCECHVIVFAQDIHVSFAGSGEPVRHAVVEYTEFHGISVVELHHGRVVAVGDGRMLEWNGGCNRFVYRLAAYFLQARVHSHYRCRLRRHSDQYAFYELFAVFRYRIADGVAETYREFYRSVGRLDASICRGRHNREHCRSCRSANKFQQVTH